MTVIAVEYLSKDQFLVSVFKESSPEAKVVWLRGELRQSVEQILGHRYAGLRIRYWRSQSADDRTAWVLDEIGKELPITAGFVVANNTIESVQILAFRESRGGAVRYPSFTRQFQELSLTGDHYLDGHIDGISGATLSVRAITRLSRLALFLHQQVTAQ
ncbi:MAG: FMN-binding protein [Immundisolibacteraceae bacterium]|nr:FMN-binding protein [Immundisolibacteraceae bacterium]